MSRAEFCRQRNEHVFGIAQPVAVITGSVAPRVGQVVAETLAAAEFRVILHGYRSLENGGISGDSTLSRVAGTDRLAPELILSGAVEDEANVVRWKSEVRQQFGRVDLLVNSAAIWDPKPLEATSAADFEYCFRVNALGTALMCQHFGLMMTEQTTGGAIVNVGDWAVVRPYRDFASYFPSKGAVQTITQSMAVELATRNPRVRVNAVLPGPVKLSESITAEREAKIVRECLLQRAGSAQDVAAAVEYLALAPFVTGVCLPVDGGRTIYAGPSADAIAHPDVS